MSVSMTLRCVVVVLFVSGFNSNWFNDNDLVTVINNKEELFNISIPKRSSQQNQTLIKRRIIFPHKKSSSHATQTENKKLFETVCMCSHGNIICQKLMLNLASEMIYWVARELDTRPVWPLFSLQVCVLGPGLTSQQPQHPPRIKYIS